MSLNLDDFKKAPSQSGGTPSLDLNAFKTTATPTAEPTPAPAPKKEEGGFFSGVKDYFSDVKRGYEAKDTNLFKDVGYRLIGGDAGTDFRNEMKSGAEVLIDSDIPFSEKRKAVWSGMKDFGKGVGYAGNDFVEYQIPRMIATTAEMLGDQLTTQESAGDRWVKQYREELKENDPERYAELYPNGEPKKEVNKDGLRYKSGEWISSWAEDVKVGLSLNQNADFKERGFDPEAPIYEPGNFGYGIGQGGSSIVAYAGITYLTKNPAVGAGFLGWLEGSDTYTDAKNKLRDENPDMSEAEIVDKASSLAVTNAVGIAMLEKIGMDALFRNWAGGSMSNYVMGALTETAQETMQTVWSNAVTKYGYDESQSLFEDVVETAIITMPIGFFSGGMLKTGDPSSITFEGAPGAEPPAGDGGGGSARDKVIDEVADKNPGVDRADIEEVVDNALPQMQDQAQEFAEEAETINKVPTVQEIQDSINNRGETGATVELSSRLDVETSKALIEAIRNLPATEVVLPEGDAVLTQTSSQITNAINTLESEFAEGIQGLRDQVTRLQQEVKDAPNNSQLKLKKKQELEASRSEVRKAEQEFQNMLSENARQTRETLEREVQRRGVKNVELVVDRVIDTIIGKPNKTQISALLDATIESIGTRTEADTLPDQGYSIREDKKVGFVVNRKQGDKNVVQGTFSSQEKAQEFIDEQTGKKPAVKKESKLKKERGEIEKPVTQPAQKKTATKAKKKPKTQKEKVKEVLEEKGEASIQDIAYATDILVPNVRRILGVGTKDGEFDRVDTGVYTVKKDGQEVAVIMPADAVKTLPKLAKEGFKADMVFLDIPYDVKSVKGGNRPLGYDTISVKDFGVVLNAVKKILRKKSSPVIHMFTQAKSGMKEMMEYNNLFPEKGFIPVARGEYTKLTKDGKRFGFPTKDGWKPLDPEGILVFTQNGKTDKEFESFNFKAVRPTGYKTEKPAEMVAKMVEMTTEEGDVVLDPFAGSGVVSAESVKQNRKTVAMEKKKEQTEKIKDRVEEAKDKAPKAKAKNKITIPEVVYHATLADFKEFDQTKKGDNTQWDNASWGFFFLESEEQARKFIEDNREPGDDRKVSIKKAKLNITNPLDLTTQGIFSNEDQAGVLYEIFNNEKAESNAEALKWLNDNIDLGDMGELYDTLYRDLDNLQTVMMAGYDGIVSSFGQDENGDTIKEYVAFAPAQINQNVGEKKKKPVVSKNITQAEAQKQLKALAVGEKIEDDGTHLQKYGRQAMGFARTNPDLLVKGYANNILTDSFMMVRDKAGVKPEIVKQYKKATKESKATLEKLAKEIDTKGQDVTQNLRMGIDRITPEDKGSKATIDGYFPVKHKYRDEMQFAGVSISNGTVRHPFNADIVAYTAKQLPNAKMQMNNEQPLLMFVEKGKVVGLVMGLNTATSNPFLNPDEDRFAEPDKSYDEGYYDLDDAGRAEVISKQLDVVTSKLVMKDLLFKAHMLDDTADGKALLKRISEHQTADAEQKKEALEYIEQAEQRDEAERLEEEARQQKQREQDEDVANEAEREMNEEEAQSSDPNIGRTWNSPYGKQTIDSVENVGLPTEYYNVANEKGEIRVYDKYRLEEQIKKDEFESSPEGIAKAEQQKKDNEASLAQEEKRKKTQEQAEAEVAEFAEAMGYTPMQGGRVRKSLLEIPVKNDGKFFKTRKQLIETKIDRDNYKIKDGRLYDPQDQSFLDDSALTKAGVLYAQWYENKAQKTKKQARNEDVGEKLGGANKDPFKFRVHVGINQYEAFGKDYDEIADKGFVYFRDEESARAFVQKVQEDQGIFLNLESIPEPEPKVSKKKVSAPKKSDANQANEDVGEKIGGARKDLWQKQADSYKLDYSLDDILGLSSAKALPELDYENLIENGISHQVLETYTVMRAMIPKKPASRGRRASYKAKQWAQFVYHMRNITQDLLTGDQNTFYNGRIKELLKNGVNAEVAELIEESAKLYRKFDYINNPDVRKYRVSVSNYRTAGSEEIKKHYILQHQGKRIRQSYDQTGKSYKSWGDSIEDVFFVYEKIQKEEAEKKKTGRKPVDLSKHIGLYETRYGEKVYFAQYKRGSTKIRLEEFATIDEAREALKSEAKLQEWIKYIEEATNFDKNSFRNSMSDPEGRKYRQGDVTAEEFMSQFGFRGVEFGNWVNQAERQERLNYAYDAFMDLATVLKVPARSISLNGELGFAFGSRGRKGALAHYEPDKVVINLTKTGGAGTVAHEWGHALDNYFARKSGHKLGYLSERGINYENKELIEAFNGLMGSIYDSELYIRSADADASMNKTKRYFSSGREMFARAVESYVQDSLNQQNMKSPFLVDLKKYEELPESLQKKYPYASETELGFIRDGFDSIFSAIQISQDERKAFLKTRPNDAVMQAKVQNQERYMQEAKAFLKDFKDRMKMDFNVHFVETISGTASYNPFSGLRTILEAEGLMSDNSIVLSEALSRWTAQHEVGHLVFHNLHRLPIFTRAGITQSKLLEAQIELDGEQANKPGYDAEEQIMLGFEAYLEEKSKPKGIIGRFYALLKKLYTDLLRVVGKSDVLSDFYEMIAEGRRTDSYMVRLKNKGLLNEFVRMPDFDLDAYKRGYFVRPQENSRVPLNNDFERIHDEDLDIILDFIDNAHFKREDIENEIEARQLAEIYSLDPEQSNGRLALDFKKRIEFSETVGARASERGVVVKLKVKEEPSNPEEARLLATDKNLKSIENKHDELVDQLEKLEDNATGYETELRQTINNAEEAGLSYTLAKKEEHLTNLAKNTEKKNPYRLTEAGKKKLEELGLDSVADIEAKVAEYVQRRHEFLETRAMLRDVRRRISEGKKDSKSSKRALRDLERRLTHRKKMLKKKAFYVTQGYKRGHRKGLVEGRKQVRETIKQRKTREAKMAKLRTIYARVKKATKTGNFLPLDYQRQLLDLFDGFDFRTMTEKTRKKLQGTADFFAKQEGEIPSNIADNLKRLSKTPIGQMSDLELDAFLAEVLRIYENGVLKKKLLKVRDEKQLQENIDKLVASTHQFNKDVPGKKKDSFGNRMRRGMSRASAMVYDPARFADYIDGAVDYRGENYLQIVDPTRKQINEAELETNVILEDTLVELKDIANNFTKDEMIRMTYFSALEQGAESQAEKLREFYESAEKDEDKVDFYAPKSVKEARALEIMRTVYKEIRPQVASTYEAINNRPFPNIANYMPLVYDTDVETFDIDENMFDFDVKKTSQGFTIERQNNVNRVLNTDIFSIFVSQVKKQVYYAKVQPELESIKALLNSPEYKAKADTVTKEYWQRYLTDVATKGRGQRSWFERLMDWARGNMVVAILGYKISTVMIQLSGAFDGAMNVRRELGFASAVKVFPEIVRLAINKSRLDNTIEGSHELQNRKGGQIDIAELNDLYKGVFSPKAHIRWFNEYKRASYIGIRAVDQRVATAVYLTLKKGYMKEGLTEEQANSRAEQIMVLSQSSHNVANRPQILNSSGTKFAFPFSSFIFNAFNNARYDSVIKEFKQNESNLIASAKSGVNLSFVGMAVSYEVYMYMVLSSMFGYESDEDEPWWKRYFASAVGRIPGAGWLVGWTGDVEGLRVNNPTVEAVDKIADNAVRLFKDGATNKEVYNVAKNTMVLMGFPGAQQIHQFLTAPDVFGLGSIGMQLQISYDDRTQAEKRADTLRPILEQGDSIPESDIEKLASDIYGKDYEEGDAGYRARKNAELIREIAIREKYGFDDELINAEMNKQRNNDVKAVFAQNPVDLQEYRRPIKAYGVVNDVFSDRLLTELLFISKASPEERARIAELAQAETDAERDAVVQGDREFAKRAFAKYKIIDKHYYESI